MSVRLDLDGAANALANGGVVAIPTDTVYGLAARWDLALAVANIFSLKRRPANVALPVLVASLVQIEELGVVWPNAARRLSDVYWPGPLTIAVPTPPDLAQRVGSLTSIGWRQPAHPVTLALLERSGPLAVTSANEHQHEPAHSVEEVLELFAGTTLAGVLDAGPCSGVVSSVVEIIDDRWLLRREGAVSREEVAHVLARPDVVEDDR